MQHERAAIMALTFCIGFTTALIAYGISTEEAPMVYTPSTTVESQRKATASSPSSAAVASAQQPLVELTEEGLYYVANGTRTMISVDAEVAPDVPEAHTVVHASLVSPNGRYVFYCVETLTTTAGCSPRIFDYDEFGVYPVTTTGAANVVDPANLTVTWGNDGRLQMNEYEAASADIPWQLQ